MRRWFDGRGKRKTGTKRGLSRALGSLVGLSLVVSAAWVSMGCDSESFVPARPEELRGALASVADNASGPGARVGVPTPSKAVEVILDHHGAIETDTLKTAARIQAGHDKARIKVSTLADNEPSSRQAALIREAVARHPLGLVVELSDPNDQGLESAVHEAQDAGIPVVLSGLPFARSQPGESAHPDSTSAKASASANSGQVQGQSAPKSSGAHAKGPLILVTPSSFVTTGKQLVASAIRNTKNAGVDPRGGAVLVVDTAVDRFVEERVTAIRDALKAAGVTNIKEIRFQGDSVLATTKLTELLAANPDIVLIFSLDHLSFIANREVRNKLIENRPLVSAGYTSDEQLAMTAQFGEFAGLCEYLPGRVLRKAVSTAVAAAQGRELPRRIEVAIVFHDSPENTGADQAKYKGKKKPRP